MTKFKTPLTPLADFQRQAAEMLELARPQLEDFAARPMCGRCWSGPGRRPPAPCNTIRKIMQWKE